MRYTQNSPTITYIEVLAFICKKNWVNWSKNHRAMTIFVPPQRNSWKSSFRPDWPNFENFKLGPRAQFLANRPNSFFVDHIDTRSLGGIHHWASRGTAGRELRSGQIPPPPALNKLDQRPLYIGLKKIGLLCWHSPIKRSKWSELKGMFKSNMFILLFSSRNWS